jgi:hypothetical protein
VCCYSFVFPSIDHRSFMIRNKTSYLFFREGKSNQRKKWAIPLFAVQFSLRYEGRWWRGAMHTACTLGLDAPAPTPMAFESIGIVLFCVCVLSYPPPCPRHTPPHSDRTFFSPGRTLNKGGGVIYLCINTGILPFFWIGKSQKWILGWGCKTYQKSGDRGVGMTISWHKTL